MQSIPSSLKKEFIAVWGMLLTVTGQAIQLLIVLSFTYKDKENPVTVLNISLTEPVAFNVTDAMCIDCESGSYNYSYAVQVSHSYPGTNAKLNIGKPSQLV